MCAVWEHECESSCWVLDDLKSSSELGGDDKITCLAVDQFAGDVGLGVVSSCFDRKPFEDFSDTL